MLGVEGLGAVLGVEGLSAVLGVEGLSAVLGTGRERHRPRCVRVRRAVLGAKRAALVHPINEAALVHPNEAINEAMIAEDRAAVEPLGRAAGRELHIRALDLLRVLL